MVEYAKPWLSLEDQVDKLESRGVRCSSRRQALHLLESVGYYRLTGYLYPFRESHLTRDDKGQTQLQISSCYRPGTSFEHAADVVDFDRHLRLLVLDGIERLEVSLRTTVGHTLGRVSPFAHREASTFIATFTEERWDAGSRSMGSNHASWLERVAKRQADSDETFVNHFRSRYDGQIPIWALTEILEFGHLGRLYGGLTNALATQIASHYRAPSKRVLVSWIGSLNYVRNISAHHGRLFNRKLVAAPSRPRRGVVPLLDHLREETTPKEIFGVYNALAVMAFLLRSIDLGSGWPERARDLVLAFPAQPGFTPVSMGVPPGWTALDLWR